MSENPASSEKLGDEILETPSSVVKATDHSHSPAAILASTSRARTLTISDQHANILLTTHQSGNESDENKKKKALLKLTLVPFHRSDLACLPNETENSNEEEENSQNNKNENENEVDAVAKKAALVEEKEKSHSTKVLTFLSKFDWRMTSESGAEYSFHEAFLKKDHESNENDNDYEESSSSEPAKKKLKRTALNGGGDGTEKKGVDKDEKKAEAVKENNNNNNNNNNSDQNNNLKATSICPSFKAELIYPASERQLSRAMPSPGFSMIHETPALYETVTKPFIDDIISSGSLSWLQNIVQVKKEKERLLWNAEGWILNIDTKWRSHPDALTVPRSEWRSKQHKSSIADLYCLGIVKAEDGRLATLRDLTKEHLPVLYEMMEQGPKVIEEVYGVKKDQLRIFVHYQPQFYHFHVHYTRLENEISTQVERAHLLSDIIQNLESDTDYYKKRNMVYKLSLKDKLYKKLLVAQREKDEETAAVAVAAAASAEK